PSEIGDDSAVGDLQAGTVVIEGPSHLDRQAMLTSEVNAKGFTVPFRLIVTGTGPGAGDVATIGFRRGDAVPGGITVYLAAGIVQDSFDRLALLFLCHAVVEHAVQTVDVGVHLCVVDLVVLSAV